MRRKQVPMKRCIVAVMFFVLVYAAVCYPIDVEPYTYRQDFETYEICAWSGYPPIQDTAFEIPFIHPGKVVPTDEGTVMRKIIWPEWNKPHLTGVVKKLNMRLDRQSRIRFRYYIKTTIKPSWLGIDLPLENGDRIRSQFPAPETNTWIHVDVGIADILSHAGRTPADFLDISALAVTVRFEGGDTDIPICLGFDDFIISGYRAVTFKYSEPKTETLAEWEPAIALKHYRHDDNLVIEGSFLPSEPDRITASIASFDKPEKVNKTFKLKKDSDLWTTGEPVKLEAKNFPAGMYEVTLTGQKKKETIAGSKFTFIVLDDNLYSGHPRLWFDSNGKEEFLRRLRSEKFDAVLKDIRKQTETNKTSLPKPDIQYDLNYFPDDCDTRGVLQTLFVWWRRIGNLSNNAFLHALLYLAEGKTDDLSYAKTVLLNMSGWPTWQHPWFLNKGHHTYYPVGYTGRDLALTYDFIHDELTSSERKLVQDALIRKNVIPAYETYVLNNMVTCQESNWVPRITGGALMCMLSVIGDIEDTSTLEPYLSGMLYKHKAVHDDAFGRDGAYGEGFSYYGATVEAYARTQPSVERCLGIDISRNLHRSYNEILWASDFDQDRYFTFGDSHGEGSPTGLTTFAWLIEKYRDPHIAWLYDRYVKTPGFMDVLYDTSDVPRERPSGLKGAKWFRDVGTVVFRSGDEIGPFVLTFRCGPFANHQHLDQGTFDLADRGEFLVTEQGYSAYYTDTYYQSHIVQPISHNCILIDSNPQSQRTGDHGKYAPGMHDHAKIISLVNGDDLAFAQGELGPVYLGNVRSLTRGMLYIHPRTVLVIDKLETEGGEASMDVLFHGPKHKDMTFGADNTFTILSGNTQLTGTVVLPSETTISLAHDPVKLAMFTDDPIEPLGRVTVTTESMNGKALTATVLSTEDVVENVVRSNHSVFLELDGAKVLLNKSDETVENKGLTTNGRIVAVSDNGAVLMAGGTTCGMDGITLVNSDSPIDICIDGGSISFSAVTAVNLDVYQSGKVRRIFINGIRIKNWKQDKRTGLVSLKLPDGHGKIITIQTQR